LVTGAQVCLSSHHPHKAFVSWTLVRSDMGPVAAGT
jgi:hypothetical protein